MSKFFSKTPSTVTDSIAFSTLMIAGLLTLAIGSFAPLPQTESGNVAAVSAKTEVANQSEIHAPAGEHARG